MDIKRRHHLFRLIALVLVVLSLSSLACSVSNKLFVDTEATTEAIQKTDEAQAIRSTQLAMEQTQQALNSQATQMVAQATQDALNLQSTQQAQEATRQAQQSQSGNTAIGTGQYSFYIQNNTSQAICFLYMSSSTSDQWGNDVLGSSNTISANSSFTVSGVPAGSYDLKAEDCSHNEIATQYDVAVPENDTWTLSESGSGGSGSYSLTVENDTDTVVYYMYISPSTSNSWGDDWLENDIIFTNETYTFYNLAPGNYDLKAEDRDHNVIAQYDDFNIPTYDTWTIYD